MVLKSSQQQRIILGLRETSIKRYVVERTNKAEIRPKEKSEKAESCRENTVETAIQTERNTSTK